MKDLRPISLCNVLYRILAKVLANRLRKVIPTLISEEQSAFVAGRSIIANVMVAFETIHSMKKRRAGKWGDVAVKIDISKAYDRVEWQYLEAVLHRFGFADKWVHWMMMCVRSVHYMVLVNGEGVGPIVPSRGLRQGCPLSPFLFILCAEGLSAVIKHAVETGRLQGSRVVRGAPWITHLLFVDDSFFFARATFDEARELRKILDRYALASGHQKSGILFSRNTHTMLGEGIAAILGIHNPLDTGRYLGLPSCVGRNKRSIFLHLKDRIWKRIQTWRGRKLSQASREILIKAVAQAIPTYFMNTFLLTGGIIYEIEKLMNSFWWGTKWNGGGGIPWMRWKKICLRKEFGGMGFRDILGFNLAMLGAEGSNPSFIWRSVRATQALVRRGLRWRLGDGCSVNIWTDPWLRDGASCWISGPCPTGMEELTVSDLLIPGLAEWDEELLEELVSPSEVLIICLMTPPIGSLPDCRIWNHSRNGNFTVRSAYRLYTEDMVDDSVSRVDGAWKRLWSLTIPPRMKHLIWRLTRDVLPTRAALASRRVPLSTECGLCAQADKVADVVAVVIGLWQERNQRVWEHKSRPEEMIVKSGRDQIHDWRRAQEGPVAGGRGAVTEPCKRWHRPPLGYVKLNVDAAFFHDVNCYGIGLALRGRTGQLMGFKQKCFTITREPKEGEAQALLEGLYWLQDIGHMQAIVETDCQVAHSALQRDEEDVTEFGVIINKCKELFLSEPGFSVVFVRRDGNGVAHTLARRSITEADTVLGQAPPIWLRADLANTCFVD
ncbi:Putative ribonuclease H protein At1g65750, partial [Linum grandiflorum]